MNIVSYNLVKFQDDHKIKTTKLSNKNKKNDTLSM